MLRPVRRLLVTVLLVFAACGGGLSDEEQVHAVVERFARATAAKDYQTLCDKLLAPKLVEQVESAGLPCEVALAKGLGDVRSPTLTIGKVAVKGDTATAQIQTAARGQAPSRDTLHLVRDERKSWRIASLAS
jgi:ketosteroid isomerase-like protein